MLWPNVANVGKKPTSTQPDGRGAPELYWASVIPALQFAIGTPVAILSLNWLSKIVTFAEKPSRLS